MAFQWPYKRLGIEKGDELHDAGIDRKTRTVKLEGTDEVEICTGDRIRWTR